MSCNIKKLKGITLNGSKVIYGGALQSFSLSMCGLSSQIKATASLVSDGGLTTPGSGDDVTVSVGGLNLKMQVGGYNLKSSGAGATTMTLNLYDTSNRFLDNFHITLAEEEPKDVVVPNNVAVLGLKFGPLPDDDLTDRGVISASPDTEWGDLRNFYEKNMKSCPDEDADGTKKRIDESVRGSTGKTLYTENDLSGALAWRCPPFYGEKLYDFRGTAREVLVQYGNAIGSAIWWDMEKEEVMIVVKSSANQGKAKLKALSASCEILSSSETIDYTNTLGKGAIGQVTSSFQGENQSGSGREMSRFLTAAVLDPVFKYTACRNKKKAVLSELKFTADVLKAIQAAVNAKIFAAYALQAGIAGADMAAAHPDILKTIQALCPELIWENKKKAGASVVQHKRIITLADWETLLPLDQKPAYAANAFLQNYYKAGEDEHCSARLAIVKLDNIEKTATKPGIPLKSEAIASATGLQHGGVTPKDANKKVQAPQGWNTNPGDEPFKSLGAFEDGKFTEGKILMQKNPFFDSIIGPGGLTGENDILRQYLLAIQKFRSRFYVIKKNGLKRVKDCDIQSIGVAGKSYGYYITSEAQGSPLSLDPVEGFKKVALNPFTPLGECSCAEIVALAQTLALMYLPAGTSLDSVMGRRADPDNPIKALQEGTSGAAVIDFIYALQSDGKVDPPVGQKQGLEAFFTGTGALGATPVRRAKLADEKTNRKGEADPNGTVKPQLSMYILVADKPEGELADIPQISFTANADQREGGDGGNQGELQEAKTTAGPAQKAADTLITNLGGTLAGVNDIKGLKGFSEKTEENDAGVIIWGLNTMQNNALIDLNSTVPAGFFSVNGVNLMEGEAFIPPASLSAPGPNSVRVWFRVQGSQNSFGNSTPGEFTLAGAVTPAENCWKQKYDFGISVNAADIGKDNVTGQSWPANELDMANPYSMENRSKMLNALFEKLKDSAISETKFSSSQSITFLMVDGFNPNIPTMAEGLESLQISLSGNKTEVSITVGDAVQKDAQKSMTERMVQSPSPMYRPGNLMGDSVFEKTTPKFQNLMKGN